MHSNHTPGVKSPPMKSSCIQSMCEKFIAYRSTLQIHFLFIFISHHTVGLLCCVAAAKITIKQTSFKGKTHNPARHHLKGFFLFLCRMEIASEPCVRENKSLSREMRFFCGACRQFPKLNHHSCRAWRIPEDINRHVYHIICLALCIRRPY